MTKTTTTESTIRFLHTADLHLGFRQYGMRQRELDFFNALDDVFNIAIREKCNGIILAGDIFDTAKPTGESVARLMQMVTLAKSHGITVYGIEGNHDLAGGHWLEVCGIVNLDNTITSVNLNGVTINIAGIASSRPSVFKVKLEELTARAQETNQKIDILTVHQPLGDVAGFERGLYAMDIAEIVKPVDVKYVALGDIHQPCDFDVEGIRFCYPGATETNAKSETSSKTVVLLEFDTTDFKMTTLPLKSRQFTEIEIVEEKDLTKLANLGDAFVHVSYIKDGFDNIVTRIETALNAANVMYRLAPITGMATTTTTLDRTDARNRLVAAITAFFDEDAAEAQLIASMLGAPDTAITLAENYYNEQIGVINA